MLSQGFSMMSLGAATVRQPVNPMMHPGAGMGMGMGMMPNQGMGMGMMPNQGMMGMVPNQGMMGMGMNMGMPTAVGMGMMSPAMVQQPKQDAFADFANFGK